MRELPQKVAKFEEPTILSISIFERPPDNPVPEPDSDHDEAPDDVGGSEKLRLEAETAAHKFTHRPKNPFCKVCQRAKMMAPHARKKGGSSTIASKKFGDHITIDHVITKDFRDFWVRGGKGCIRG